MPANTPLSDDIDALKALVLAQVRAQRDKKTDELGKMKSRNDELRKENAAAGSLIRKLTSENARLVCENAALKTINGSSNVMSLVR